MPRWPRSSAGRWARSRPTCTAGCGSCASELEAREERTTTMNTHRHRQRPGRRLAGAGRWPARAAGRAAARPWPRRCWSGSAWPTPTSASTGRPGRCWSPTTAGGSRPPPRARTRPGSWSGSRPGSGGPCGRPAGRPSRLVAQVERLLTPGRGGRPPRYDLRGTSEFERAVLAKAQEIPRGQVRPYAWVAGELGQPAAVRAVGAALGRNPVPVLIPCHRVVGSDGRLTGYAWGVPYKRTLLAAEGADPDELERLGPPRHPLLRQRHHPHLLLPHLPPRPPHHRRPPDDLHGRGRGGRRRLPPLPGLPAAGPGRVGPAPPQGPDGLLGRLHRQELVEDVGDALVAVLELQAVAGGGEVAGAAFGGVEGRRRWRPGRRPGPGGPRRAARPWPRPGRPGTRPRRPPAGRRAAGPRGRWPAAPCCPRRGPWRNAGTRPRPPPRPGRAAAASTCPPPPPIG